VSISEVIAVSCPDAWGVDGDLPGSAVVLRPSRRRTVLPLAVVGALLCTLLLDG